MIWALWAVSATIIAAVAYAVGWHRADVHIRPQPVPVLLRKRAEEHEAKSKEHMGRNALDDAKAVQLRIAANLMEIAK